MRALIYYVATSLDGLIADPDGGFSAFTAQGDHVDAYLNEIKGFGAVIMGRKTYAIAHDMGVTDPYPMIPQALVVSTTMTAPPDPRVELVATDVVGRVGQLKAEDGAPIWLCGGSQLAGHLWTAGVIDQIWVKLNPLVLGAGLPLLGGVSLRPTDLELTACRRFDSGVCELRYRVSRVSP